MSGFAGFTGNWVADAAQLSVRGTGSYDPNSELAQQYARTKEDGGSRVDDEAGWREIHRDQKPKNSSEYAALQKQWSDAGFDMKAIDMGDGDFTHANFAVKPKGSVEPAPGDTEEDLKFSPQVQGAIERVAAYRDRAWSGQHAQDVFGKSKTLANGVPASAGSTGKNKSQEAADLATRETYFDAEKYKRDYGEEYKASNEM